MTKPVVIQVIYNTKLTDLQKADNVASYAYYFSLIEMEMNGVLSHDSELWDYTGPGTT